MDDLVSRKAVEMAMVEKGQASKRYKVGDIWELNCKEIMEALESLPSVQMTHCDMCRWKEAEIIFGYPHPCQFCVAEPKEEDSE